MQNYYQILNLEKFSSAELVKKQYRTLVKQAHPDVNPSEDANSRFLAIQEAYECLINPLKKKEYDNFLKGKSSSGFTKTSPFADPRDFPKNPVKHYKNAINSIRNKIRDIEFFNLYNLKTELDKILNKPLAKHLCINSSLAERTEIFNELLPFVETLNEYPVFEDYLKILDLLAGNDPELKETLSKYTRVNLRKNVIPKPVAIGCSFVMALVAFGIIYQVFIYEPPVNTYKQIVLENNNYISHLNKLYIENYSKYPNAQPYELELRYSKELFKNKKESCYNYPLVNRSYCRQTGSSMSNETQPAHYDMSSSNTIIIENKYAQDIFFILKGAESGKIYRNELVLSKEKFALLYLPNEKFNWYAQLGELIDVIENPAEDYPLKFKEPNLKLESQRNNPIKFTKTNNQKVYHINFAQQQ